MRSVPNQMNQMKNLNIKKMLFFFPAGLLFFISFIAVFYKMSQDWSDILPHITNIVVGVTKGSWPPHFLYHIFVYLISFGSTNIKILIWASIFTLSLFVFIKMIISFYVIDKEINLPILSFLLGAALVFITPIVNWWRFPELYIGQISPNVWHNPTTIFVMPFSMMLFYVSLKAIDTFKMADFAKMSLLLVANALAKPNYLLAFLPIFAIYLCYAIFVRLKKSQISIFHLLVNSSILILPVIAVLLIQYIITFQTENNSSSSVVIAPLKVWHLYSPHIRYSILVSLAFPIVYSIVYLNKVIYDRKTIFSWAIFIIALLQYIYLAEEGDRFVHGNFYWGSVIAISILFLNCTAGLFKQKFSWKYFLVLAFFLAHLASGIFYYIRLVKGYNYI